MSHNQIRQDFRTELAKTFLDDLQFQRKRYFYTLGSIEPWSGDDALDEQEKEDLSIYTEEQNRLIRSEMVFAKQINPNDISLVVRKIIWDPENLVQFDSWDHTLDMRDKNFYVINTSNQVFKCLDNGANWNDATQSYDSVTISSVMPEGENLKPFRTSDGYLWKYMYTIAPYAVNRFSSVTYMPVKRAISDSFYNNGAVDSATVLYGGAGYTDVPKTQILVSGGTFTGAGASVTGLQVDVDGRITGVTGLVGGSNYVKGVRLSVTTSTGIGAVLEATTSDGSISGVTIIDAGIGYSSSDTIVFNAAVPAELLASVDSSGSIQKVVILDGGVGYVTPPTLEVVSLEPTQLGSGKWEGNSTALLEAIVDMGSVVSVSILDPGINYPVEGSTTISVQGDGVGAAFTPVVYDGQVIDVLVDNPGTGYTNIVLTVNNSSATDTAIIRGIITQSDYTSIQAVVEQTAVAGAIYKIVVDNPGFGYDANTTSITIEGNGTGASAEPIIENNSIIGIVMTEFGSDYTYANINIVHSGATPIQGDNIATAYAVLPPTKGHGYDAPSELLSNSVVINTPLRGELADLAVQQDYRTFAIIKDPKSILTGAQLISEYDLLAYKMRIIDVTNLLKDMVLTFNNERFRVLDFDSSSVLLVPLTNQIIPSGTLTSESGGLTFLTTELLSSFEFDKYSGKLLFYSTENPFEFSDAQSITVKTFITF